MVVRDLAYYVIGMKHSVFGSHISLSPVSIWTIISVTEETPRKRENFFCKELQRHLWKTKLQATSDISQQD